MKKIVFLLGVLAATSASASAVSQDVVARYQFGNTVADVTVQGDLQVANNDGIIGRFHLSKEVADTLKGQALTLSSAEIVEDHRPIVCMMMPPEGGYNDNLLISVGRASQLKLVDGPHGCWVSHVVHPKEQYYHNLAHLLKGQIKILALELIAATRAAR
jgi:hypothetical protein